MNSRGNLLFVCVLLGSDGALAQTSGTISGFTRDPAGAFVPGVTITVTNERTGAARSTTSDQRGFYQVLALVSGVYAIEAELTGFKRYRNTGVVLKVDENIRSGRIRAGETVCMCALGAGISWGGAIVRM